MSPVDFKKWLCRPVEFKGQRPSVRGFIWGWGGWRQTRGGEWGSGISSPSYVPLSTTLRESVM